MSPFRSRKINIRRGLNRVYATLLRESSGGLSLTLLWQLPFAFGSNFETATFLLNLGIPIVYLLNSAFLWIKLRSLDNSAQYYQFIKSLAYFFLFYGLGAIYFVWYDFIFMQFQSPNPIDVITGVAAAPSLEVLHYWKIGVLLQNIGLFMMLSEIRGKIFKEKWKNNLPLVWQAIGILVLITWGFIDIPGVTENAYFWAEVNFLFNFSWSIILPLTYGYIYKNSAGNLRKYAFILFLCLILYGIAWGFRTRFAVHLSIEIFAGLDPNPFNYELIWFIRAVIININLLLVFYAYSRLLKEMTDV